MDVIDTIHVLRYEDNYEDLPDLPTIFLAGPTVRGNQPHLTSWRFAAIDEFAKQKFQGNLIVPEFVSKTQSDKGVSWIPKWEYRGLSTSDVNLFWIPRTKELIGLTTNMEFGYWQARQPHKIIYGRPDDAYRISYLDIMWQVIADETEAYEPRIYNNLPEAITAAIAKALNSPKAQL